MTIKTFCRTFHILNKIYAYFVKFSKFDLLELEDFFSGPPKFHQNYGNSKNRSESYVGM